MSADGIARKYSQDDFTDHQAWYREFFYGEATTPAPEPAPLTDAEMELCPCCGGVTETRDWVGCGLVRCRGCGLTMEHTTRDSTKPLQTAIVAWNQRIGQADRQLLISAEAELTRLRTTAEADKARIAELEAQLERIRAVKWDPTLPGSWQVQDLQRMASEARDG